MYLLVTCNKCSNFLDLKMRKIKMILRVLRCFFLIKFMQVICVLNIFLCIWDIIINVELLQGGEDTSNF